MKSLPLYLSCFGFLVTLLSTWPSHSPATENDINCQQNVSSSPLLLKLPIGKHRLEVKKKCKNIVLEVFFADGRVASRQITLVDSIPSLLFNNQTIAITDIFNPSQDSFETEHEFQIRRQQLLEQQQQLLTIFNQAVQQHDLHYQAGVAYLDKENYKIKNKTFPVRIEWQTWTKAFELPHLANITATQKDARALWKEGQQKPVYVYMGTVGEQVRVSQQVLIGLDREWIIQNPLPTTLLTTLQGHKKTIYSVAFSPDGRILASGSRDNTIKLWNVKTRQEINTLQNHGNSVYSVDFSPDGKILASGSKDKTIKLWDVHTGKVIRTWRHKDKVRTVTFSHNGKILASGSYDKTIKLWDVNSGRLLHTLDGHKDGVLSVAFNPDGRFLASGGRESVVKLWDVNTGTKVKQFQAEGDRVWSLAFNPDGTLLAAGTGDNSLKLWEVKTGEEYHTLQGHGYWVLSLSFSQDGRILASGSNDSTIRLWEVHSGKQVGILQKHGNSVFSVAFSPDSHMLASGSKDETIKLWGQ